MSLRSFCLRIFQHCPLLASFSVENHMRAFEEFLQYKTRVPVRGAILLNEAMDSAVLVKGWKKGAGWSFPRGKINKDEDDLDCAIREAYEETGFDIRGAGLVPRNDEAKYIQISMREQQIRLYVFRNVPMDTPFQPKTRKEISKIEWYKLSELPAPRKKGSNQAEDAAAASNANKFYMVAPFVVPLKKWVLQQKKKDGARVSSHSHLPVQSSLEDPLTEDDIGAQTDQMPLRSASPPAIETIEGATLELQRLLKVQPPTQGLQISPSNASAGGDKGGALMALLRQKSDEPGPSHRQNENAGPSAHAHHPQTPLDHTYANAPEPPTPHHHHAAQRLPGPNYQQPPPNFPIPHLANQAPQTGHFNYARPHVNITPQSHVYGRNPYMNQGAPPPRKEPVLLHPQPLPPQVQQSLLIRDILPTPNLPNHASQNFGQSQYAPPNAFHTQLPAALQPLQQGAKLPPQLPSHKMSLLNAFKNDTRPAGENKPPAPAAPVPNHATQSPGHQAQYNAGSWPNQPSTQGPNPRKYPPHDVSPYAHPSPSNARPQAAVSPGSHAPVPRQGQPTDAHRSSLLEMFKKSAPLSPTNSESTVKSGMVRAELAFTTSNGAGSPGFTKGLQTSESLGRAPEANGTTVRANPEVNLAYRNVQILSRHTQRSSPKSDRDQGITVTQVQNHVAPTANANPQQSDSRNSGYRSLPSPRDRSFLRQGENQGKGSPRFSLAAQAAGLPYGHSPQQGAPALAALHQQQQQANVQRWQDATPEQKQKLLSLFSKDQSSPTGYSGEEKGKHKEASAVEHVRSSTPRSRVASLASAGGENVQQRSAASSRRGSGTPISPADRNFLLSYLESVSSSGR